MSECLLRTFYAACLVIRVDPSKWFDCYTTDTATNLGAAEQQFIKFVPIFLQLKNRRVVGFLRSERTTRRIILFCLTTKNPLDSKVQHKFQKRQSYKWRI